MAHKRLKKVQKFLEEGELDALLVEGEINLFYLTGLRMSAGSLLVYRGGARLVVDGRYYERCKQEPLLEVVLAPQGGGHSALFEGLSLKKVAFDSLHTPFATYVKLEEVAKGRGVALIPSEDPVQELRMVKEEGEIALLREAAALGSRGFDHLLTLLQEGVRERDLADALDLFWKRAGGQGVAFEPIVAFGPNSSMPHHHSGESRLMRGHCVLIDIGVTRALYHSDMTRVVFFGTPDPEIEAIYPIVRQAQEAALALCQPGTAIGALDRAARGVIEQAGLGERFPHGLGHGIGLEVHERPIVRDLAPDGERPLKEGMVITVEPGIYLPGVGGVRIEDTVVITKEGYDNLTSRSKELSVHG